MKKLIFASLLFCSIGFQSFAQIKYEFQQMTAIESVVAGGAGRSRLITTNKDGSLDEVKLNNFFSLVGINFGNIKENDQTLARKIEDMVNAGWELVSITPGVYSGESGSGIFITRYLFKRVKP